MEREWGLLVVEELRSWAVGVGVEGYGEGLWTLQTDCNSLEFFGRGVS